MNSITHVGITGALGNIGTTLTRGLGKKYSLKLYDIRSNKSSSGAPFYRIDFARQEQLSGIFDGLDALIHLSGDPRPDAPQEMTFRNNFVATSYVFEEARTAGVKKIVFASSNFYHQGDIMKALQGKLKRSITLDMPPTPACPYGKSKVFGENVGRHMSNLGMQFAALRIGWSVPEDDPSLYSGDYMRAMFCSKRDLVQAFDRGLTVDSDFVVGFATSRNRRNVFDLTETTRFLGFDPVDDAENYF
jgi:nucleoside-diphosphate-sugar epimerase